MKTKPLPLVLIFLFALSITACGGSTLKSFGNQSSPKVQHSPTPKPQPTQAPTPTPLSAEDIFVDKGDCTDLDPHPVGKSIAEKFSVSYEEVMIWHCSDFSFEDILLALQTSKLADQPPQDLLILRKTKPWDAIWQDLGITDTPDQ